MKKKYKVNEKEQKQAMNEGVNKLTSEAVLEKHNNTLANHTPLGPLI